MNGVPRYFSATIRGHGPSNVIVLHNRALRSPGQKLSTVVPHMLVRLDSFVLHQSVTSCIHIILQGSCPFGPCERYNPQWPHGPPQGQSVRKRLTNDRANNTVPAQGGQCAWVSCLGCLNEIDRAPFAQCVAAARALCCSTSRLLRRRRWCANG